MNFCCFQTIYDGYLCFCLRSQEGSFKVSSKDHNDKTMVITSYVSIIGSVSVQDIPTPLLSLSLPPISINDFFQYCKNTIHI